MSFDVIVNSSHQLWVFRENKSAQINFFDQDILWHRTNVTGRERYCVSVLCYVLF